MKNVTYTIEITREEMALIFDALGECKLRVAGPLFSKLQQVVQEKERSLIPESHLDKEL